MPARSAGDGTVDMGEPRGELSARWSCCAKEGSRHEQELAPFPLPRRLCGVLELSGLVAAAAAARPGPQTAPGDPLDPRTYAPDSQLFLVVHAIGVQKYTCQADGTWLFTDPEATLYKTTGVPKPIGSHFLNFASGRPVWQLKDGSSVEAARTVTVTGAGRGTLPGSSCGQS
jgi:hypothetical protein